MIDLEDIATRARKSASITTEDMDVYVATTGSDVTGDGSSVNPYATIQYAVNSLPDLIAHAVTIHIADGTYYELVSIRNKYLTSPSASLTLLGNTTTPANVVISGATSGATTTPARKQCVLITNCTYVTLNGLQLEYGGADTATYGQRANLYIESAIVHLQNIRIVNGLAEGVYTSNGTLYLADYGADTNSCVLDSNNTASLGEAQMYLINSYCEAGLFQATNGARVGIELKASTMQIRPTSTNYSAVTGNIHGVSVRGNSTWLANWTDIGGNTHYGILSVETSFAYAYSCKATTANGDYDLEAEDHGIIKHAVDQTTFTTNTDSGTGSVIF